MSSGRRRTQQGEAIHAVIREAGRPLAPAEILGLASARVATLSQATVYRQIRRLLDDAAIREVVLPGSSTRYEDASGSLPSSAAGNDAPGPGAARDSDHHHFFHCEQCDAVFPVAGCAGDVERLAPPEFRVRRHEVVLYGECRRCVADADTDPDADADPDAQSAG
jgi:Fur family ferric uptake transcriptional regulator